MRRRSAGWLAAGGVAAIAALIILWSVQALGAPLWLDQGVFVWMGDVILKGGVPYRDGFDVKGPVAYYAAAVAQLLFGRHEWGLRAFDLLWMYGGALLVATIARRLEPGRVAPIAAAALFLLWYAALGYHGTAQPDGWAGVVLAGMALLLVRGREASRPLVWAAAAGACLGVCVLLKPTYALFGVMSLAYGHGAYGEGETERGAGRWRRLGTTLGAVAIGAALPIVITLAYFAARGALDDLWEVYFRWNVAVYAREAPGMAARAKMLGEWLVAREMLVTLPLTALGVAFLARRRGAEAVLMSGWALAAIATVVAQGRFLAYHWTPCYPPLAVLAGVGIASSLRAGRAQRAEGDAAWAVRWLVGAVVVASIVSVAIAPATTVYRAARAFVGERDRDAYEAREYAADGRQRASIRSVARYVQARTRPDDAVLLFAQPLGHLYLIDRRSPTRLPTLLPLFTGADTPFQARYRRQFMGELQRDPPAYVVVLSDSVCASVRMGSCAATLPEFDAYLREGYVKETEIPASTGPFVAPFAVLRRRATR